MTKTQIIASVLGRLHRTGDTVIAAAAATEILAVQDKLELGVSVNKGTFLPWFLHTDKDDIVYSGSVDAVNVPSDYIQESEEQHNGVLFYYDSTLDDPWVQMSREPYVIIKSRYPGLASYPRFYDIINDKIFLRPRPENAGVLRMMYSARQTTLDLVETNGWTTNAAELFICELGYILAGYYIRDQAAAQTFSDNAVKEASRLYTSHISKLEAGRERQRGDD